MPDPEKDFPSVFADIYVLQGDDELSIRKLFTAWLKRLTAARLPG